MSRRANEFLYDAIAYLVEDNEDYKEAWINYRMAVYQDNKKRMIEAEVELAKLEQEQSTCLKGNPL